MLCPVLIGVSDENKAFFRRDPTGFLLYYSEFNLLIMNSLYNDSVSKAAVDDEDKKGRRTRISTHEVTIVTSHQSFEQHENQTGISYTRSSGVGSPAAYCRMIRFYESQGIGFRVQVDGVIFFMMVSTSLLATSSKYLSDPGCSLVDGKG